MKKKMHVMQLVRVDDDGRFHVGEEAVRFLESIPGRVGLLAIAGKYRTGKSWILNQLCKVEASEQPTGFGVGSTVQRHTLGLWIASRTQTYRDKDGEPFEMVFMDMEGLSATQASENHDVRMFALGLLLASYFIYNSRGAIDEEAITMLAKVADISQHIRMDDASATSAAADSGGGSEAARLTNTDTDRASSERDAHAEQTQKQDGEQEDDDAALGKHMPEFLWLLRDFSLQLRSSSNKPMTPNEYLAQALSSSEIRGTSDSDNDKRAMRQRLRTLLPNRNAATLPRPADDERALQELHKVPLAKFRPVFRKQMHQMRKLIEERACVKRNTDGAPVSGAMLARFVDFLVSSFNSKEVPVVRNSWAMMADLVCRQSMETAAREWATLDEQRLGKAVSSAALDSLLAGARARSFAVYDELTKTQPRASSNLVRYRRKLEDAMDRQERRYRSNNASKMLDAFRALLDERDAALSQAESAETLRAELERLREERVKRDFGDSDDIMLAFDSLVQKRVWSWLRSTSERADAERKQREQQHETLRADIDVLTAKCEQSAVELGTLRASASTLAEKERALQARGRELAEDVRDKSDRLAECTLELGDCRQRLKQQESEKAAALLSASTAANERVAAADERCSTLAVELETKMHECDSVERRLSDVQSDMAARQTRIGELEAELAQLAECKQQLRERNEKVDALQRNHDELRSHMTQQLAAMQSKASDALSAARQQADAAANKRAADAIEANTTEHEQFVAQLRQTHTRAQKHVLGEHQQALSKEREAREQTKRSLVAERDRAQQAESKLEKTLVRSDRFEQEARTQRAACVKAEQRIQLASAHASETEKRWQHSKQEWALKMDEVKQQLSVCEQQAVERQTQFDAQMADLRERHRVDVADTRREWSDKLSESEVAKTNAIQEQLAQQMSLSEQLREQASRLAVAESRAGELKRRRDECEESERECKRLRSEMDDSQRMLNRATGERDALQRSHERLAHELTDARTQIGALQREASDKQFQLANDLFNARMQEDTSAASKVNHVVERSDATVVSSGRSPPPSPSRTLTLPRAVAVSK